MSHPGFSNQVCRTPGENGYEDEVEVKGEDVVENEVEDKYDGKVQVGPLLREHR